MNTQPKNNHMKVDKYDRQIRLWGPRGQKALAHARVALVKCTGAGIEALKNLVLPAIGTIDIWDESKVRIQDLSSSFFYEQEDVGKSKAQAASKNLLQMNEDCHGSYFQKSVDQFLDDEKSIKSYSLVIFGGELTQQQTVRASKTLWNLDIPCIFITVVGYFFYIRLQKKIHFVEMSNTMSKKYYLRISDPFPQLLQHAKQNCVYEGLQKLQGKQPTGQDRDLFRNFSQIPEVLILISVVSRLPAEKRKNKFVQEAINQLIQKANPEYRQNLRQTATGKISCFMTPSIFMIDIGLLNNKSVQQCTKDSHIMLKFLWATNKIFTQTKNLPQPTNLPDLNTTTQRFINLKNIYKTKHNQDIKKIVKIIKQQFGDEEVDQDLISNYINNLSNLQVVEMRPYYQELEEPDQNSLQYCYYQDEKNLLLAVRTYQKLYGQKLGEIGYDKVKIVADDLQKKYEIKEKNEDFIKEVHRGQGKSNINIYSIAGAMTGQQAIKMISGCFAPMSGGYLFDGAHGRGYQVRL